MRLLPKTTGGRFDYIFSRSMTENESMVISIFLSKIQQHYIEVGL